MRMRRPMLVAGSLPASIQFLARPGRALGRIGGDGSRASVRLFRTAFRPPQGLPSAPCASSILAASAGVSPVHGAGRRVGDQLALVGRTRREVSDGIESPCDSSARRVSGSLRARSGVAHCRSTCQSDDLRKGELVTVWSSMSVPSRSLRSPLAQPKESQAAPFERILRRGLRDRWAGAAGQPTRPRAALTSSSSSALGASAALVALSAPSWQKPPRAKGSSRLGSARSRWSLPRL
jgi:hypothetical protein